MNTKQKLKSLFAEHWKYMTVSTACRLNLFNHLPEARTAMPLADDLLLNEGGLLLLLSAEHVTAFQDLESSIKTGKSSFKKIYGLPFFDYLNEHPEKLHAYHKAMYQAEAIILSRVLHDWNREKASIILENCFNALPNNETLYVIENCSDKIEVDLSLLLLNMTVMYQSHERTSAQYISRIENVILRTKPG